MVTPEFGQAYSVPYEFYASVSGLVPKTFFTLNQHKLTTMERSVGYQYETADDVYIQMFVTANSGLTPANKYSVYEHARAYFNKYTPPNYQWQSQLILDLFRSNPMAVVLTDTLNSLNDVAFGDYDALDYQSVYVQITGTYVATIAFEVSNDGVNWVAKNLVNAGSGLGSSTTTNNVFSGDIGARYFRVRMSAFTSGSATVTLAFSVMSQFNPIGTQTVQGTVNANLYGVAEQAETTTNLAASATYTGATRDLGSTATGRTTLIRPVVLHTAGSNPGSLVLQESTDGTTWRETRRVPVPSDASYRTFEFPIHLRYYRFLFINGATAQTAFFLQAIRSQGEGGTMDAKSNLSFLLSTTALAASGTFTGPTLDLGDNHIWNTARARVNLGTASTTVTIRIESSHDGTTWAASAAGTTTTTAAGLVVLERPVTERYIRLVVVNGATAQASNQITLNLVSL